MTEGQQPDASVLAMAITHGLNTNIVRKWLVGHGLKRMGDAVPVTSGTAAALQFVPVELQWSEPVAAGLASQTGIRPHRTSARQPAREAPVHCERKRAVRGAVARSSRCAVRSLKSPRMPEGRID